MAPDNKSLLASNQKGEKHLQLRVALTEAELLSVLRPRDRRAGTAKSSGGNKQPRGLSAVVSPGAKSEIVALFSTKRESITLSGLLHNRFPLYFVLRPDSPTYKNFIRFVLRELRALNGSTPLQSAISFSNDALRAVESLSSYFETKLRKLDETKRHSSSEINEIIDVFGGDLEISRTDQSEVSRGVGATGLGPLGYVEVSRTETAGSSTQPDTSLRGLKSERPLSYSRRSILDRLSIPVQRQFRLFDQGTEGSNLVSGFVSLEIEELSEVPDQDTKGDHELISSCFSFTAAVGVTVQGDEATFTVPFSVDPALLPRLALYIHWGERNGAVPWVDEEVSEGEIQLLGDGAYQIAKVIRLQKSGTFGVTAYVQLIGSSAVKWAGEFEIGDATFEATISEVEEITPSGHDRAKQETKLRGALLHSLSDFEGFVQLVDDHREDHDGALERALYELTRDNSDLRNLVSDYYSSSVLRSAAHSRELGRNRYAAVLRLLQNLGIGEVVLVSPEGPHAVAGGIAQVIVGLMDSLSRNGLGVTLITPLYEESQGNKHKNAESVVSEGVRLNGEIVPLQPVGSVKIAFGPTYRSGTKIVATAPKVVTSTVYLAQSGRTRIFFVRHKRYADRLYGAGSSDELFRKAIFLSRGALEIICDRRFNIAPGTLVTNDWCTALVPALAQTDKRYVENEQLKSTRVLHIIHNCGFEYQGRLFVNQQGEDLFPLLGIESEHFFKLADPNCCDYLNLTAAAINHSREALLTVSRPYAEQLLCDGGADGLQQLLWNRRNALFGISNGVDLAGLRRKLYQIAEDARSSLGLPPLIRGKVSDRKVLSRLFELKAAAKHRVQGRVGLAQNSDSILISFVGRLAEQKGLSLLTDVVAPSVNGKRLSTLEAVLDCDQRVQIFIGGPPSMGYAAVEQLRELVECLSAAYPGRVSAVFDFIKHEEALEITGASDLFLMPSRYEPGGITQLEALAAGTLVIARNVGGISATLKDFTSDPNEGCSFLFQDYSAEALRSATVRAVATISNSKYRKLLVKRAALAENDWDNRLPQYLALFQQMAGILQPNTGYPHLDLKRKIIQQIRPESE